MGRMLTTSGLDVAEDLISADMDVLSRASYRCLLCSFSQTCRQWLDDQDARDREERSCVRTTGVPRFCPNADQFNHWYDRKKQA